MDQPIVFQALLIHVDQLGAEFRDPETTEARRDVIRDELEQWYAVCTRILEAAA